MNIASVPPPFWRNVQLQNEFHLHQIHCLLEPSLDKRCIPLNHGKTMAIGGGSLPGPGWIWMATEMTFLGLKIQTPIFLVIYSYQKCCSWFLHGTVRGVPDDDYSVSVLFILDTDQFNEPWNWSNHSGGLVFIILYESLLKRNNEARRLSPR